MREGAAAEDREGEEGDVSSNASLGK